MLDQIVSLTKQFVSIKSHPENPVELERILELALSQLTDFSIERFEDNGVKSALIYNTKKRPEKFKILLNGHLDVIPGKEHQYIPVIKGDRLYGVGALDMKASVACLITAFKEAASSVTYPLGLQLVTDEEIGGFHGTKYQIDKGVRADFVIAGETTNFNIVNKAKGILWTKISCKGKTAHGAYPWRGDNAIWKMNSFLNKLQEKFPVPEKETWMTTVNLSKIETTNGSFNKIPDDCTVSLDIRYIPEDVKTITKSIKQILPKGFTLEFSVDESPLFVHENNSFVQLLKHTTQRITGKKIRCYGANGSSDARHFTRVNGSGVEFGPVGGEIGTDSEWTQIPSLEIYVNVLKEYLLSL